METGLKGKTIMVAASYITGQTLIVDGGITKTVW